MVQNMNHADFENYIKGIGILFKTRGNEIVLQHCPYCETETDKGYDHFYFSTDKQVFKCHKCGVSGNIYSFMKERGDIGAYVTRLNTKAIYKPKEDLKIISEVDQFYSWYEKERGISKDILQKYKVGRTKRNDKTWIVYQYYKPDGTLFNRKYRSPEKHFETEKDAAKNYYGLQFVNFKKDYLIVCEGEDDCHALAQYGFENAVSVPFGACNYTPEMDEINRQFKGLILFFDNDFKGQEGARQFAEKAGLSKCQNIFLPFKDSRDCLLNNVSKDELQNLIQEAKYFEHEEIIKADAFRVEVIDSLYHSNVSSGTLIKIRQFNDFIGGIRENELSILTGHTGHGKTTFALNLLLWAEEAGLSTMLMSFENRHSSIIKKLIQIISERSVFEIVEGKYKQKISEDEFQGYYNILAQKNIYYLSKGKMDKGYYELEDMKKIIEYAVKFYNIKFFVIDHLHYFLRLSDAKNPLMKLDESIRDIKQLTEKLKIHIVLIVHTTKGEKNMTAGDLEEKSKVEKITLYSGKGSSSISQEADNFWVVYRDDKNGLDYALVNVLKNRDNGNVDKWIKLRMASNKNTLFEAV